jgi:hypothetical protein
MRNTEPIVETFYDATTDTTIQRELTAEELAQLPKAEDETPTAD